jgi:hypothetical protein
LELLPQELRLRSIPTHTTQTTPRNMRFGGLLISNRPKNPMLAAAHNQGEGLEDDCDKLVLRDVVETVTFTVAGVGEFNCVLAGIEQLAPVGAPVQLKATVPEKPADGVRLNA